MQVAISKSRFLSADAGGERIRGLETTSATGASLSGLSLGLSRFPNRGSHPLTPEANGTVVQKPRLQRERAFPVIRHAGRDF